MPKRNPVFARFLGYLRGLRNRVSFMPPTDNRNFHDRNPVSEPPRSYLRGLRNRVSGLYPIDNRNFHQRNPVSARFLVSGYPTFLIIM